MLLYEELPVIAKKHSGEVMCAEKEDEYILYLLGAIKKEIKGARMEKIGGIEWGSPVECEGVTNDCQRLLRLERPRDDIAAFWANANKNRPWATTFTTGTTEPYWVTVKRDIHLTEEDYAALNEMTSHAIGLPLPDDDA
eukprot:TRINITY_DN479_c0_g1_i1.p1 TRINITY_DN479_c0_g1~~TRINITY_DN479_c0_g1_i1.p1  ORF type:complete len:139 (+),score=24.32 TRINITY_DN479_c0_g1_i1:46-462(+)